MVCQFVVNILVASASTIIVALGFSLVLRCARFFHFAHGAVFTSGPYFALVLHGWLGAPIAVAVPSAIALSSVLGCAVELGIYRPLRRNGASSLVLLLASLGVYVVCQNLISLVFGDATHRLREGGVQEGFALLGARVTSAQVGILCCTVLLVSLLTAGLVSTRFGKSLQAVSSNPLLASVCGVDSDRVILYSLALGSGLASLAGILTAFDVDMTPTMGMSALMTAVVAVVVGGRDSILGIILASLLLATAQQLGAWYLGAQWQDAIAFLVLLTALLFRPHGLLGREATRIVA